MAMKFTAAGDAMVLRRLPGNYPGFQELQSFINQGDFRFVNMETTIHNHETYGAAESGGTWFCSPPGVLEDAKTFGFNILTTCNNHALDYGHIGLEKTLDYVEKAGFPNAGAGRTLADAAAPVYIDTPEGRIALIGACSTFHPACMAGEQTRTMVGRPGINGIRYSTTYQLPEEDLEHIKRIADAIGINGSRNIIRKEGYLPPLPEGKAEFGELMFEASDAPRKITKVNPVDMERMEKSIKEALYFADYVIVSMHSHELKGIVKSEPSLFYEDFAHKCIDAGAHAIVGTGPHLLRPIEIYKGRPIFYSLGDFIIQLENIRKAPADMYEKQKLDGNARMDELFDTRNHHGTRGLCYEKVMFEAIVPYWEMEDGKLTKLVLMPVELNFDKGRSMGGWPRPKYDDGILERLAEMSEPYGTKIDIVDGMGIVRL
ncbi:MAG: CapA family protein [Oscillospiraceae bacterium]|nr:CapA family protein [Oscillospiraceae bacterium]